MTTYFDFGTAIGLLKKGEKVARKGWNSRNMFVYYVPANKYPVSRNLLETMKDQFENDLVPYQAYIAMKTVDNTVVPWLASQTDMLSEDWELVENEDWIERVTNSLDVNVRLVKEEDMRVKDGDSLEETMKKLLRKSVFEIMKK